MICLTPQKHANMLIYGLRKRKGATGVGPFLIKLI